MPKTVEILSKLKNILQSRSGGGAATERLLPKSQRLDKRVQTVVAVAAVARGPIRQEMSLPSLISSEKNPRRQITEKTLDVFDHEIYQKLADNHTSQRSKTTERTIGQQAQKQNLSFHKQLEQRTNFA